MSIWHYSHLLCHSRSSTCRSRVLHKRLSGIFHLSAFRSQPKLARIMRQPLNPRLRAASNLPLFTRRFCLSAPYPLSRLSRPRFLRAQRSLRIGGGKKARRRLYIYRAAWWLQSFIVSGRGLDAARDFWTRRGRWRKSFEKKGEIEDYSKVLSKGVLVVDERLVDGELHAELLEWCQWWSFIFSRLDGFWYGPSIFFSPRLPRFTLECHGNWMREVDHGQKLRRVEIQKRFWV